MKNSGSWEEFDLSSRVDSKLETISLSYIYDLLVPDFPDDVKHFLLSLEDKLGGARYSVIRGSGSDFLSPVTPAIGLVVSLVAAPFIRKYLDGLLNGDALKNLGETHHEGIALWFSKLEKEFATIVEVTNDLLKDYPDAVVCRRQKTDLVLRVDLGSNKLSVALNRGHSNEARAKIPSSIVRAVKYIVENPVGENLGDFTLRYDSLAQEWRMHVTTLIKLSDK